MGSFVDYASEIRTSIPAEKAFKAFVLESDDIIRKVYPEAIQSVEILEGDGGPGTIKKINFGPGSKFKFVKQRVDSVDRENLSYIYTVIEGDVIGEGIEKIENEIKIEAAENGSSILKSKAKYYTQPDFKLSTDEINMATQKTLALFKAIEGYVIANP